jgi:hypothetical protein
MIANGDADPIISARPLGLNTVVTPFSIAQESLDRSRRLEW